LKTFHKEKRVLN